jgi:hypothetical protein
MYFLNIRGAIEELRSKELSGEDCVKYLVASFTGFSISRLFETLPPLFNGRTALPSLPIAEMVLTTLTAVFISFVAIVITYFVLRSYYKSNGGAEGRDFLARVLVVTFVLTLRSALVVLPMYIAVAALTMWARAEGSGGLMILIGVGMLAVVVGWIVYVIAATNRCLKEIAVPSHKTLA